MTPLISRLITEIVVSILSQKALKCFGKKEYADIIKLAGFCVYGVTIILMWKYIQQNSATIAFLVKVGDFLTWIGGFFK